MKRQVPKILRDNLSVITLSHNHVFHSGTRHMKLDIFFVREKVINKSLILLRIPAPYQLIALLTKSIFIASLYFRI